MKKSTFLFLVTVFMLFNHSCREDVNLNEANYSLKSSLTNEKGIIDEARAWFENNPSENQFSLLETADKLKWEKAVVNYVDIGLVVEIPIIIKDSRKLKIKNNDAINIEQRLLIIYNGGQKYSLIEFFISSGNNESLYHIKKLNFSTCDKNFEGTLLLLNNCGEIILLKQINKELVGSEIKLKSKIIEEHCIVIVDRATGEIVDWITCYFIEIGDDGGGGGTTNNPSNSSTPPEVTLDPSFQNTKAECVYNKLVSTNLMENLLQDFMGSDRYNVTYEVVPKLIGSSGEPAYGKCFHNPDGSLTIKINSYYFDKVAPVHLANTILHETIHAYLFRKVDEIGGLSNLSEENFERLFAYYKTYGAIDYQHDYISQFYIDDMASTLRQFDQNKYSTDYYEALSWSGLHYTYGWQIMTENQKNEIRNKVEIINSGTKDCK